MSGEPVGGALDPRSLDSVRLSCSRFASAALGRLAIAALLVGMVLAGEFASTSPSAAATLGSISRGQGASAALRSDGADAARKKRRRAGCGTYCQQAGPVAGGSEKGADGPLCPPYPCKMMRIVTRRGQLRANGTVRVRLKCLWTRRCVGAYVIYRNDNLSNSGRLGGGDFAVPARATRTIEVPLLARGRRLVQRLGTLETGAYVHIRGFGGESLFVGTDLLAIVR